MSWRRSQERAKAERRVARRQRVRIVSPSHTADEETAPHRVLLEIAERDFNPKHLPEEEE